MMLFHSPHPVATELRIVVSDGKTYVECPALNMPIVVTDGQEFIITGTISAITFESVTPPLP